MKRVEMIEKEEQLLEELKDLSLRMLERVKKSNEKPGFDFKKAREVIERMFYNELDYLIRESDDYYELYLEDDFKDQ